MIQYCQSPAPRAGGGRRCLILTSSSPRRGFQLLRRLEQQLRFAVHWPGYPVAFPRSHGVPRRDVPGCVHIGVDYQAAGAAPEPRLALSRFRIAVPAVRASLGRVRRLDFFQPARRLLPQSAHEQAPSGPQDLPVEPGLGADVPARVFPRALRGSRHVADLQTLDPDQVEAARDVCASFLGPVIASVGFPGAQLGNCALHPPAAVRAAFRPSQPPLQALQPRLLTARSGRGCATTHPSTRQR